MGAGFIDPGSGSFPRGAEGGDLISRPGCRTRILLLALVVCGALAADPLDDLAREFWEWRAIHQPVSGDDMARIDRPADWTPDWSAQSVAQQKEALASFEKAISLEPSNKDFQEKKNEALTKLGQEPEKRLEFSQGRK